MSKFKVLAAGHVLSQSDELSIEEQVKLLYDSEGDEVPEGVVLWEKYQYSDADTVRDIIDGLESDFLTARNIGKQEGVDEASKEGYVNYIGTRKVTDYFTLRCYITPGAKLTFASYDKRVCELLSKGWELYGECKIMPQINGVLEASDSTSVIIQTMVKYI